MSYDDEENIERLFPGLPRGDFWVFAYGSLMWRPDFRYTARLGARALGYRRSLCVWSWHHRGTKQHPGLVFGLDPSDADGELYCDGCVFRVKAAERQLTLEKLKAREMITEVYQPTIMEINTEKGKISALAFVVNRTHPQYAGRLTALQCAKIIRGAKGKSGGNSEYVRATYDYLCRCGVYDDDLNEICLHLANRL